MSVPTDVRATYLSQSVGTASPGQLLVMLWERLVLDVERGLRAQLHGDHETASTQLLHAQACLTELQCSLDPAGWEAGPRLMALYGYLRRRLIVANVKHDQRATKEALIHCRTLRDTWKRAAELASHA